MATDALALMDHLGWKKAHVFGHSMGAMIACKLAAMAPHRLCSLALLNVTGGGFQCFPKVLPELIWQLQRILGRHVHDIMVKFKVLLRYPNNNVPAIVASCILQL
ncbi:Dihydrolipoyllysine-residue acetyltransferase component of acetoin cleaving system [Zea mays]|uniref:Dihydrolipoyllysine-residue acetyltransferase component of acetoin cleaving system n=1 Tax=Zea mays TaxID=4577 RepID=A0A3L6FGU6_MAIZE|nr:Dihydrolipoyllysine-residue acetyltransferase component of acetoin cleaving system [Zea mays]